MAVSTVLHVNHNYLQGSYFVILKKVVAGVICVSLLLIGACQKEENPDPDDKPPVVGEASFGAFKLLIDQSQGSITFGGKLYDGAMVNSPWETVMEANQLKLLKPAKPFCSGCTGICVAEDSCAFEPMETHAGKVTVSGVSLLNGNTSFTSSPIVADYSTAAKFTSPPCKEGDTIALSAAGSDKVPAFDLKVTGIDTLVMLTTSLTMADNQPIEIKWIPAKITGNSRIHLVMDISYHGGTKAQIVGDCDDNGSVIIPAAMLTKLKSFGFAGFPKITFSRISTSAVSAAAKAKMMVEATLEIGVEIPGLKSCNSDGECLDGQKCKQPDRICE